eukprot:m.51626 g.51626  ORF g.51626 m.51626 type:complete len:634 (-) comp18176_c0_seq1:145-2046(-)
MPSLVPPGFSMLDLFSIFTKSGIVLWCFQQTQDRKAISNSVNQLVWQVFLEKRSKEEKVFENGNHAVQFTLDNEFDLVFVVVYQKLLTNHLSHLSTLLDRVRAAFCKQFQDALRSGAFSKQFDFNNRFLAIRNDVEQESKTKAPRAMKSFEETSKFKKTKAHNEELQSGGKGTTANKKKKKGTKKQVQNEDADEESEDEATPSPSESSPVDSEEEEKRKRIEANQKSLAANKAVGPKKMSPFKPKAKSPKQTTPKTKGKKKTTWNNGFAGALDFSGAKPSAEEEGIQGDEFTVQKGDVQEVEYEPDDDETPAKQGGISSWFSSLVGDSVITAKALQPVLEKMRLHLIGKNVASDIAAKLVESVGESLEGKSKSTFKGISSVVKETLEGSLTSVLSAKHKVNILRDVKTCKAKGRPFTMVFCGVNGVGKSTNLAKICFWLMSNGLKVCVAACDTFRAGAVEQLRTHCKKLTVLHEKQQSNGQVLLYEKGYGKDDAGIAADAISFARDQSFDVVLIDTAGRMQDNEPLMRSLAKLVRVNQPDLVLFVGEALVGNEAVDQLSKFNKALADFSDSVNPRLIDGIVLTKFDTIDDKVGAAISMTYTTGQPIVFIGTGQNYPDLKRLNVKSVVQSLLRS